ncbi:hypothetical protein [Sinomicrobium soli]|uniref:hypothetical protein n=1 Tax=Sinomicrobium sp. N-1-3-6 TaxID=2219864 RepID=UPI0013752A81|nr:hypothetical protein [Sinomicrobium sp. N-1-3-6]
MKIIMLVWLCACCLGLHSCTLEEELADNPEIHKPKTATRDNVSTPPDNERD